MVAPASNIKRPLRFWEQICSNMGVTMGFELEGKVTPQIVKDAFAAIQKEYPYLRTVLTNDMNQLAFVEQPVVVQLTVTEGKDLPNISKAITDVANTLRDHGKSVIYLDLFSKGDKHVLVSTLNHAGMDALNGFQIYDSFFNYIGLLSAGKPLPEIKSNIFADVLGSIPESIKKVPAPKVPEKFMAPIAAEAGGKAGDKARVQAFFTELPEDVTAALIKKCHDKGVTVQGAVSAASAVANAAVQAKEFPLPQTLLLQCPCSVRDQVEPPVKPADGGQGASLLWWAQEVTPSVSLWAVAAAASAAIKKETEAKGGLAFWSRMYADKTMFEAMGQETPFFNPPFTATASSIGKNPIAAAYGPVKVKRTHLLLATYGVTSPTEAGHMTHAHTFNNKLNLTFSYNIPAVGEERAKRIAATQEAVLRALASGDESAQVQNF
ncbi:hypothetical protein COCSUDRAFT_62293 [Coccomyxa subellipsoidea C-169]|uniref:Phthiocerol/phthiodiolone dimycocerosyl transferase C-terminal domain-containing protein n=1 Tax=Coccomyxa subellipsoidea (strain C-169) TaxID=574566 RepID=I0Z2L5_COCSC|nr:hypothetical protein COCSUDRAFT_62293 [Coccomyxa subellipsoidea C-169]EIE24884.1 hypothetical protein COCSUDRAFT_62293 [Coccomyxa subellipsoidea C-169]|eukprot:XP_005649428.1 hypothetical protein COCSUDRAFT_62293 [Coccomyxa subellipsoidea C-169]